MPRARAPQGRRRPARGRRPLAARWAWLGAAAAGAAVLAAAAAPAALAVPPRQVLRAQQAGQVSISIESVSPRWATPGHPVTVSGVVRNGTAAAVQGLAVQLMSSASPFGSRDALSAYASGQYSAGSPEGADVPLAGAIQPYAAVPWHAVFQPSAAGMTQFGVYPLAAQVVDSQGVPGPADRTFLPFWPGGRAAQQDHPLRIAWIWPLIDRPYQAACPALTGTGLAASLVPGGRLGGLLAAAAAYSGAARLTWAIDPALVQTARTMSMPYLAGGNAGCAGAERVAASSAAGTWLKRLRAAVSGQAAFLTPYADVDVSALSHDGLDADLRSAFALGRSAGQRLLGLAPGGDTIAWPPAGLADSGVLGSLAVNGIATVVLDSSVMPPSGQAPTYTPSAQASAPSGVGSSLRVLLADHTITHILGSGGSGPGAAFATGQRFLAETAMIVAERPSLSRSLVVAPPRRWNPPPGLAADLLSQTVRAPWLKPVSLAALASARNPGGEVSRTPPPAHAVSGSELGRGYLAQVSRLDAMIGLQASILTPPDPSYLAAAVAALESSAWRNGAQAAARQELLGRVRAYLAGQGRNVSIIDSGNITLGGSSGKVPISIDNRMHEYTVTVRVRASVAGAGRLTIARFPATVTVPPGNTVTIRLPVRAKTVGVTQVTLALFTPGGRPLPGTAVRLSVHTTRFGRLALVILSVALAVFVLTLAARAIRRRQHGGPGADRPAAAASPGSVVSGNDLAHDHPPEDPDEYADARGRASR